MDTYQETAEDMERLRRAKQLAKAAAIEEVRGVAVFPTVGLSYRYKVSVRSVDV